MKTPREFWLNKYTCEFHIGKLSEDDFHVIEYSAYEALKEKYDELVSYLPKVPTEPYEKELAKEALKLKKQNEILVEALEFYADFANGKNAQPIFDDENSNRAQIYEAYKKYSIGPLGIKAQQALNKIKRMG